MPGGRNPQLNGIRMPRMSRRVALGCESAQCRFHEFSPANQPNQVNRYAAVGATTREPTAGNHDLRAAERHDLVTPVDLSAPRSHTRDSTANNTKNDNAVYLTAHARPSRTPPARR